MLKRDEISDPNSCWNKALDNERLFVLLERDLDAPETIRFWVDRRIKRGKNKLNDPKMQEALQCALLMEQELKRQKAQAETERMDRIEKRLQRS